MTIGMTYTLSAATAPWMSAETDGAYLEVALRRQLPLGSRDRALRGAAKRSGVKLL
jgi:hypothetical protein